MSEIEKDDIISPDEIKKLCLKKFLSEDEKIKLFTYIIHGYDDPVEWSDVKSQVIIIFNEYKEMKKEINFLKSHLGKDETEWIIKRDLATRTNRILNEPNDFGFPLDFDENKAHHLSPSKKNPNWYYFEYYYNNDFPDGKFDEYDMPCSLFDSLCKKKKPKVKQSIKKKQLEFKESKNIIDYLEEHDEIIDDLDYLDVAIDFLWDRKGKKFGTNDFKSRCEIGSSSTVQNYLKMFVRYDIIIFLKKGWYKVNIK